jgi:chemotaxis protein CheD
LINQLKAITGTDLNLRAKLAGGASMFATTIAADIGVQNIESCQQILRKLRIPIIGQHCGGNQGRRMWLDTSDGKVRIEIVGQGAIEL